MLKNRTRLVGAARCCPLNAADLLCHYPLAVELMTLTIVIGQFTTEALR